MHINHDWDHELILGRDDLGLNNIESTFDWCFVSFLWKLIFKDKNMAKLIEILPFFYHELIQINNDIDIDYMKFIQFWVDLTFFLEKLSRIRRGFTFVESFNDN